MNETLTPVEAWQRLREGNDRFVQGESSHPNQDASRRASLVDTQQPFALLFGCSDSRLAAEIIFDLGLGDMFVVRTAGQVIDEASLGSLEFGIADLNIPLIIILGHDSCGAVTATKRVHEGASMPAGFRRNLVEQIMPSVLAASSSGVTDVNSMVVEHVKQVAARLVETSRIISDAVDKGETAVLGVTYHLADGHAELVSSIGIDPQS